MQCTCTVSRSYVKSAPTLIRIVADVLMFRFKAQRVTCLHKIVPGSEARNSQCFRPAESAGERETCFTNLLPCPACFLSSTKM